MKTWKTITITALTTLALTIGGIFIYTNTQTSHDNVEEVKNEKVVSSSSKTSTSTSETKESSSTSTSATQESTTPSTSTTQESTTPSTSTTPAPTPVEVAEPQETTPSESTDSAYVTDVDFRQYDTNHVFQWAMSGGRCFTVGDGYANYPRQIVAYYKGYFITVDDNNSYQAYDCKDGISISALDYDSAEEVKELIDRCTA